MAFRLTKIATASIFAAFISTAAHAVTYNFADLSGTGTGVSVQGQFTVDVSDVGGGNVQFKFMNSGPLASAFEQINFDNSGNALSSFVSLDNSNAGVNFSVNLKNLPQGQNASPVFNSDFGFQATPPPGGPNGNSINPGEMLGITFSYSTNFAAVLFALDTGGLRIATHVISLPDGSSDTLITTPPSPVPLPAGGWMLLAGIGGLMAMRRRKSA